MHEGRWLRWVLMGLMGLCTVGLRGEPGQQGPESDNKPITDPWQIRVAVDGPPQQIYEEVRRGAESRLRGFFTHRPPGEELSGEMARQMAQLRERIERLETTGLGGGGLGIARMFAPWSRWRLPSGQESPQEQASRDPDAAGPDQEILLATGEVVFSQTDVELPERGGLGVRLVRTYRSHVQYDGPFGPGWDHNLNQRLVGKGERLQQDTLLWLTGRRAIRFHRQNQQWVPEPGAFYQLRQDDRQIVIEDGYRTRWEFEPSASLRAQGQRWRIASISTPHEQGKANRIRFHYQPETDLLIRVEDPFGNQIRFSYDPQGRITGVEAPGKTIIYRYDFHGRLIAVETPKVARALNTVDVYRWEYTYWTEGIFPGWLKTVVAPGGRNEKQFFYEADAQSAGFGGVRELRWQARQQPAAPPAPCWEFQRTDQADRREVLCQPPEPLPKERWVFPVQQGRVSCYAKSREIPARNAVWQRQYNTDGLCTEAISPSGQKFIWEYNSTNPDPRFRGNLLVYRELPAPNAPGLRTKEQGRRWTYHAEFARPIAAEAYEIGLDGQERILEKSQFQYNVHGDLVETRTGDRIRRWIYNQYGMPVVYWDGRGCATVYRYYSQFTSGSRSSHGRGLLAELIEDATQTEVSQALQEIGSHRPDWPPRQANGAPCQRLRRFEYNPQGLLIEEIYPQYRISRLYNRLGMLLAEWDSRSELTLREYDETFRRSAVWRRGDWAERKRGGVQKRQDLPGQFIVETFHYDPWGRLTVWRPTEERFGKNTPVCYTYEYYPSGLLKRRGTPGGTSVAIQYDPNTGWPESYRLISNSQPPEELLLRKELVHDAEGFVLSYRDARGEVHRWEKDGFGRQHLYVRPDGLREETFYDGLARPIHRRWIDPKGPVVAETKTEYDALGRPVLVRVRRLGNYPPETQQPPIDQWLTASQTRYDPEDNPIQHRSYREDAWEEYTYDGLGRLVRRQLPEGDQIETYYEGDYKVLEAYRYRANLRRQADHEDRPRVIRQVWLRDGRGQPWCILRIGDGGLVDWRTAQLTSYDCFGRVIEEIQPWQKAARREYNTLGQIEKEVTEAFGPHRSRLTESLWVYDVDGLLLEHKLYNRPLIFEYLGKDPQTGEISVRRAALENPIYQIYSCQYDSFRRLAQEIFPDGQIRQYEYGPDSRLIGLLRTCQKEMAPAQEKPPEEKLAFRWDQLGRLSKVLHSDGTLQEFDYDWQGQVCRAADFAQKDFPVQIRRWYDNLGNLLAEQTESPGLALGPQTLIYQEDLAKGNRSLTYGSGALSEGGWRRLTFGFDKQHRLQSIQKDEHKFCQWTYVGQTAIQREFPGHHLLETFELDAFGELIRQELQNLPPVQNNGGKPGDLVYEIRYLRDPLSRVIASSARVRLPKAQQAGSAKAAAGLPQPPEPPPRPGEWRCSQFYDRDPAGNLIAEESRAQFYPTPKELQERWNQIFTYSLDSPTASTPIAAYRVRRHEYDEVGNRIASYRGPKPRQTAWPSGAMLSSSAPPLPAGWASIPTPQNSPSHAAASQGETPETEHVSLTGVGNLPTPWRFHLASNRTAAKAVFLDPSQNAAKVHQTYEYDCWGRLTRYQSESTGQLLQWKLEYDPLDRLIRMEGVPVDPPKAGNESSPHPPVIVLQFAYDPFQRRIIKHVRRNAERGQRQSTRLMAYQAEEPLLVWERSDEKDWRLVGQYIWGRSLGEVVAYYEEAPDKKSLAEYLLHQDASRNVVLAARREASGDLVVEDTASYWSQGETSTQATIRRIDASLPTEQGCEAAHACDQVLDEKSARWLSVGQQGMHFLTLHLAKSHRLSSLTIWADKFPKNYRVYVVAEGQGPSSQQSISEWERQHQNDRVHRVPSSSEQRQIRPEIPLEISLEKRQGQQIVFVWDDGSEIQVREFEVFVQPQLKGDIGFSGAILDHETGLFYHGARYRLPELDGKFISPDPLGFLGGKNLYAFAHNDPLTWHDPTGQWAHILIGASVGGAFGAVSYLWQWWWYGEEFSWARLGVSVLAGAASGAVAAAVGSAMSSYLASKGVSAVANFVHSATVTGAAAGGVHQAIAAGGITYLETGDIGQTLRTAAIGFGRGAVMGAITGLIGGTVTAHIGGSFFGFIAGGAASGAAVGALGGAMEGYYKTGTFLGAAKYALSGALEGAAIGAAIGGAAWGVGRAANLIRPLPKQPEGLPDPKSKGVLIRSEPQRGDYGGVEVTPGHVRHHIKPLSLGGADTPDNIVLVPKQIHNQPHPGPEVANAPYGTIFY